MKRYALARSAATGKARPEERVRRLRLVRMEAIVQQERDRQGAERARP